MKNLLFIVMVMGLFTLCLPTQIHAQSCCAAKTLCQKICGEAKEKSADAKSASLESAKTTASTPAVAQAGIASSLMVTASYLFNHFGTTISKLASDPCCVEKGCDPAKCDVSKCEPSACVAKTN